MYEERDERCQYVEGEDLQQEQEALKKAGKTVPLKHERDYIN